MSLDEVNVELASRRARVKALADVRCPPPRPARHRAREAALLHLLALRIPQGWEEGWRALQPCGRAARRITAPSAALRCSRVPARPTRPSLLLTDRLLPHCAGRCDQHQRGIQHGRRARPVRRAEPLCSRPPQRLPPCALRDRCRPVYDAAPSGPASGIASKDLRRLVSARSGRFSVVRQATHLKENVGYAVKEVENESLDDEENLEALETEVPRRRSMPYAQRPLVGATRFVLALA